MKLRQSISKFCAALMAGVIMWLCIPAVPAAAKDNLSLRIVNVEVDPATLGSDRLVTVDVRITGNDQGFIAAEFGIAFDNRLKLQNVRTDGGIGAAFSYASTEDHHMIWFSGANVKADSGASSGRTDLFSLDFVLPENYAVGDMYYIKYEWVGVDGSPAFWYVDREQDALDSLMTYSTTGAISIPSPDAPRLSRSALTLNPNETFTLTAQNVDEVGVWFTDDDEIASVKDGAVTALTPGSCNVSVFYAEANALLTCEINVRSTYVYSMFDETPVIIRSPDQVVQLEYPNAVGMIQWLSTNSNVVLVNDGMLTPVTNGTAQIIASSNGVSKLKTVTVLLDEPSEPTTSAPDAISGDINHDGAVDILDVILLNKYLLGGTSFDDTQKTAADVLHDDALDSTDSLTLLKFIVKLTDSIPVEV